MPYGATEHNLRDEKRDCPLLLEAYERWRFIRPPRTSPDEVRRMVSLSFRALENNDLRPLLSGGWEAIVAALAPWAHDPAVAALLSGDPCDRRIRQRQTTTPRAPFRSAQHVLAAASAARCPLGAGAVSFDRAAETRGRTRARWGEIECRETRAAQFGVKGLATVERGVDAERGVGAADLSPAEVSALAGADVPMAERVLMYRAWVGGVDVRPTDVRVRRVGVVAARREALLDAAEAINAASAWLSDADVRRILAAARRRLESRLRRVPAAGMRALMEGRRDLVADESQLHGLIPPRDDRAGRRPSSPSERPARIEASYFRGDAP